MTKPERSHVTVAELATRTNLTQAAIRYHCRDGRLRGVVTTTDNGSQWLIPTHAADAFTAWAQAKRLQVDMIEWADKKRRGRGWRA